MKEPARAIREMPRSGIREIFDRANQISGAIHLEMGEPDFSTPIHIRDAAVAALEAGFTKYTPNAGLMTLREAAAAKVARVNGINVDASQVVVTSGGIAGLYASMLALCDPGDELLLIGPAWPNYRMIAQLLGVSVRQVPLSGTAEGHPTIEDLERHRSKQTKVVLLNSPSNPTGMVFDEPETLAIVEWAERHGLWILSDEVYDQITFDRPAVSPYRLSTAGNVISVFSFSKTYSMTGWRLGYTVAPPEMIGLIQKTFEPIFACTSGSIQMAGVAALEGPQDCIETMRSAYQVRRDLAAAMLTDARIPFALPAGAFYLWIDISASGQTSTKFASDLLESQHVAVTPGIAFGPFCDSFIRVSLASHEDVIRAGVTGIVAALKNA
ncbi:MAG TPA: pyridoxal phosphate-dependent aminotransferase [Candidatus Nanopelagicaceae bacterium]|nr:pyridoxal phosphate-dependent aminotransferase [Candidatus Nanopelagicaceae bacterium]